MLISLIHPSRGRPQKAYETLLNWSKKSTVDLEHILSLDMDDPYLDEYKSLFTHYIVNDNGCMVEAANLAAQESKGDILVYLSDDFDCPENWDSLILAKTLGFKNWVLKVDDCLQKFSVPILTIPIMSRSVYKHLGYFWHPLYKSMFVDEDLYWTCKQWLIEAPSLKFPHLHPANGKAKNDETYRRSAKNWGQGKAVFQRRKSKNFPV